MAATSLLKAKREGAAATAADKLFHCLIVLGKKYCWIKVTSPYFFSPSLILFLIALMLAMQATYAGSRNTLCECCRKPDHLFPLAFVY